MKNLKLSCLMLLLLSSSGCMTCSVFDHSTRARQDVWATKGEAAAKAIPPRLLVVPVGSDYSPVGRCYVHPSSLWDLFHTREGSALMDTSFLFRRALSPRGAWTFSRSGFCYLHALKVSCHILLPNCRRRWVTIIASKMVGTGTLYLRFHLRALSHFAVLVETE